MEAETDDRDLYSGMIRLHILHHAGRQAIFGAGMAEELARYFPSDRPLVTLSSQCPTGPGKTSPLGSFQLHFFAGASRCDLVCTP
jgi:hypothetical protein